MPDGKKIFSVFSTIVGSKPDNTLVFGIIVTTMDRTIEIKYRERLSNIEI